MADNFLELRDVSKSFGGVIANDAITLDIARGAIVGLIGPNGSGKTTLFNSIAGQHRIDRGSVRFDGRPFAGMTVAEIARLGLARTFQQAHVYTGMTCLENMQASTSHAGERPGAMFENIPTQVTDKGFAMLDFVGLAEAHGQTAGTLSYGQRKLLEFAMALMSEPTLLLLDEPTAGVNPIMVSSVLDALRSANRSLGITLVVIEHNMRVVMELADQIHCLARGRILASGAPEEIRSDPRVIDAYLGAQ